MPTATLLEKVYGGFSPKDFESVFSSMCKGLDVKLRVLGATSRGWIQIEVTGEDEEVALRYLEHEIGLAPVSMETLKKFSKIRGRVLYPKSRLELHVDIGVCSPKNVDAAVPLSRLQAQLADGKKLPLQLITQLFCLHPNFPLEVKITNIEKEREVVEAELTETQLSSFTSWVRSNLNRLVVLGAPFDRVEHAVRRLRLARDVYGVEPLGLLEQAVVCKMGTDAEGLIPKLGPYLSNAVLAPFHPRKILEIVNRTLF